MFLLLEFIQLIHIDLILFINEIKILFLSFHGILNLIDLLSQYVILVLSEHHLTIEVLKFEPQLLEFHLQVHRVLHLLIN